MLAGTGEFTLDLTADETNGVIGPYGTYQDVFIQISMVSPDFFWWPVQVDPGGSAPLRGWGDPGLGTYCQRTGIYFGIGTLTADGIGRRVAEDFYSSGFPDMIGPGKVIDWH
jgi:hypothetical protein